MDADQTPQITAPELKALARALATVTAAVYLPQTGRIFRCPNPFHPGIHCDRETTFTIPEAQLLALRIRSGELGHVPPQRGPIVLAYGIPFIPVNINR